MAEDNTDDKIKKSLWYSILDGSFFSAMVGFGESFIAAFAVFLQASNLQLGLLESLPKALGSISQLYSNRLTKWFNSRKKIVCIAALLEGMMYIPIALVYFLGDLKVYYLIFFVCIYWIFGLILTPAWSSWMGDLVSEKERGAYFGRRNKIAGLTTFVSFVLGGYMLQQFSINESTRYIGFAVLFSLSLIARVFSFIYLTKKYEPAYEYKETEQFTFLEFLKEARNRNYGRFVIYLTLMNFAVYSSAPFFTAYMLKDLKMDYATFTIVTAAALIMKFLTMPVWGRFSDRFGTKKVLSLTGFLMPLVPILWLFSANIWWLLLIQMYSGFVWAGFELAGFNFIFDTTTKQKRATCVAYFNVLNGFAIFFGAMMGSQIVKYNSLFWSKYLLIFLVSGMMRYIASFVFIPMLKERREVEPIQYPALLLKVTTTGATEGLFRPMMSMEEGIVKGTKKFVNFNKKIVALNKRFIGRNVSTVNKTISSFNREFIYGKGLVQGKGLEDPYDDDLTMEFAAGETYLDRLEKQKNTKR
jgi:MFS family permease